MAVEFVGVRVDKTADNLVVGWFDLRVVAMVDA